MVKPPREKVRETAGLTPPPPGAHTHEQRHGIGLGLLIGILLGLAVGSVSLLVFSLMRDDTLDKLPLSTPVTQNIVNVTPVQTPRPEVRPSNTPIINEPTDTESTDSKAPRILSTSPIEGATNVPEDAEIALTFNTSMDAETLDATTITITNKTTDEDLTEDMQFVYRADTRQVTISFRDPTASFGAEQLIEVVVGKKAKSAVGTPLEEAFELTFTTRS